MERLITLLDKIKELNSVPNPTLVEVDLMMDYTRVLYADLFEWRKKLAFNDAVAIKPESKNSPDTAYENEMHKRQNIEPATAVSEMKLVTKDENFSNSDSPAYPKPHLSNADIRQNIGINDKYQFISELFGNNKDAYEEVMSELNTFDTEEEAITWLNNSVNNQFDWNDDMESVQQFYRLLGDYYASR